MGIALVSDVEDDPVARAVVDAVKRDRQLDRSEVRSEMAAGFRNGIDQAGAYFRAEGFQLLRIQFFDIIGCVYLFQDTQIAPLWLIIVISGGFNLS